MQQNVALLNAEISYARRRLDICKLFTLSTGQNGRQKQLKRVGKQCRPRRLWVRPGRTSAQWDNFVNPQWIRSESEYVWTGEFDMNTLWSHNVWTRIFSYPERKSCGFKNIRIRVDGAWLCHIFFEEDKKTKLHWKFTSKIQWICWDSKKIINIAGVQKIFVINGVIILLNDLQEDEILFNIKFLCAYAVNWMRTILYFVNGSWLLHQYVPLQCYVKRRYGVIWYYFLPKRRTIATTPFNHPCFSLSLVTDRPSRRACNSYCVAWKTCSLTQAVVKVPYCSIIYSMTDCWFFFL